MSYFRLFLTLWAAASLVDGQSTVSSCLYTMEQLITEESSVTDYSVTREYIFCENRLMLLGRFDMNNVQVDGSGSPPFPVRPNMHVRCGESGGRENNCVVSGGDVQVDGTSYFGAGSDLDLSNVIFEGFTFESTSRYSVWATKKGDITFIDCEWKVRVFMARFFIRKLALIQNFIRILRMLMLRPFLITMTLQILNQR
jgi:hypothetical protein